MDRFGLIGRDIDYSFSRAYFKQKFENDALNASYVNFDCENLEAIKPHLYNTGIKGYNVTIPYKTTIIPLLDDLDPHAHTIGAVNTIKRTSTGRLVGFNTDYIGFKDALLERFPSAFLPEFVQAGATMSEASRNAEDLKLKALILGTGGASKGVKYALDILKVGSQFVSRMPMKIGTNDVTVLSYDQLDSEILSSHKILVNCTPLGTHPNTDLCPNIPYKAIGKDHIVFDLIYNPAKTLFLQKAEARQAQILNGLRMLELQAEAAWALWNID